MPTFDYIEFEEMDGHYEDPQKNWRAGYAEAFKHALAGLRRAGVRNAEKKARRLAATRVERLINKDRIFSDAVNSFGLNPKLYKIATTEIDLEDAQEELQCLLSEKNRYLLKEHIEQVKDNISQLRTELAKLKDDYQGAAVETFRRERQKKTDYKGDIGIVG